ncbi:hypothetical protein Acr_26g0002410 [Actinidia rufa]|uniref:Uncharacterized protein n=1 Tax=Actinidia rufa TaxID=165716 RepID=A0A7J0H1V6_9ERIC|nr:hypothetical protein Acr_26g0002410 [Actinidia rufa]
MNIPSQQARGRARSLTGVRGAHIARGASRNREEGDGENHQESVIGGGVNALRGNVGGNVGAVGGRTGSVSYGRLVEASHKGVKYDLGDEGRVEGFICVVPIARERTLMVEDHGGERSKEYEAKFTSLSRFSRTFVTTEEEKPKQFMRGLRPFIRYKIAGSLIKVYSTMVSSVEDIEKTLNETRKIINPKSQREGTSAQFEGRFPKKPKGSTTQQQYSARSSPIISVASSS